jgi:hypothetical protein
VVSGVSGGGRSSLVSRLIPDQCKGIEALPLSRIGFRLKIVEA